MTLRQFISFARNFTHLTISRGVIVGVYDYSQDTLTASPLVGDLWGVQVLYFTRDGDGLTVVLAP